MRYPRYRTILFNGYFFQKLLKIWGSSKGNSFRFFKTDFMYMRTHGNIVQHFILTSKLNLCYLLFDIVEQYKIGNKTKIEERGTSEATNFRPIRSPSLLPPVIGKEAPMIAKLKRKPKANRFGKDREKTHSEWLRDRLLNRLLSRNYPM